MTMDKHHIPITDEELAIREKDKYICACTNYAVISTASFAIFGCHTYDEALAITVDSLNHLPGNFLIAERIEGTNIYKVIEDLPDEDY